ncbi:MAG: hydantoinase/oxoprolinase family protein [Bacteroidota bacterium]
MRVATDVGGTFTDIVIYDYDPHTKTVNSILTAKTDTTPPNYEEGIMEGLKASNISLEQVNFFAHGTTVVINALTERKGAKTGLITTKGFRDVLEIARANRPDLFNFNFVKQAPFVPRHLRLEVEERINYKGEIIQELRLADVDQAVQVFLEESVEAIAVCCLHAYRNPQNEQAIAERLQELLPDIPVICSYQVNREWREYERTSSTVLSAYTTPLTVHYLNRLVDKLRNRGLNHAPYIMQSNGGISTLNAVKSNPISLVESGPASGIIGAAELGKAINRKNLIVLDIGGTTAKCSLIEKGQLKITSSYKIEASPTQAGYPIQTPVIDIVEIGNGGGSIVWIDPGGKLHVGPQSAGAVPGPAAYGKGGMQVTTTDANLLCGRIHPDFFMGGKMQPNISNIHKAIAPLEKQLGMDKYQIAKGILTIANANMVNALKLISVNKGYDPRDFSLLVIGGGGPLHAPYLAEELHISEIIVPVNAGVFSALGMLMADLRRDLLRTQVYTVTVENLSQFQTILQEMEYETIQHYAQDGHDSTEIMFEYFADMRYAGQEHYVKVPFPRPPSSPKDLDDLTTRFHQEHKRKYTFELEVPIEWVNFHLVAKVEVEKPLFPKQPSPNSQTKAPIYGEYPVDFGKFGKATAAIVERDKLTPGMTLEGPGLIVESSTSTVVPPGFHLTVDDWGNLLIKPMDT